MGKFSKLSSFTKHLKRHGLLGTGLVVGGAAGGFSGVPAGHRKDGAKEGARVGAALTATAIATHVIFRRVRGRLIPIRVKGVK